MFYKLPAGLRYPSPDEEKFGGDWMERDIKDDFIENPEKYEQLQQEYEKLVDDRNYLRGWAMENGEDRRPLPGIVATVTVGERGEVA